ncbi:unnamed protein product [Trichobilharzia regenti]|nr:unnamed protein product [Trichobilharzia regenti]
MEEIRRGLKLLIKLQIAEDDKLSERIDTLNRLKSIQTRLLMRVQTCEVGDIVNEQKINMSENDHEKPAGDSSNTSSSSSSKTSLTQHLAMIISLCQDAIKQVSTVTGLKTPHSGHQINLNNSQFSEAECSQIKKSAIHIEARAIEEIELSYLNTIEKQDSSTDVNSSKIVCIPLKQQHQQQQQQQQQKDKKVHNAYLLCNWLPNIPLAAILMSKLMVAMGDFEAASKHLENVLNKNPCTISNKAIISELITEAVMQRLELIS